jgi:foldase protein PrsA
LNVLLALVQLDLAEQAAAQQHLRVTPDDIAKERAITMDSLRKATQQMDSSGQATTQPENISDSQEEQLLDQLLLQQRVSRAEFNVILEVNANLRKIAEPIVEASLTDDRVRQQFNAMYGEKVLVRYIQCNNMSEIADVRRDLAAGKSFEEIIRQHNATRAGAPAGGELGPFSLQDMNYPPEIKQVAFDLKPGEISDPVQYKQYLFLFQLVERIPPAHAKFEDYRDAVRKELAFSLVQAKISSLRNDLANEALSSLQIRDPVLARQWDDRVANAHGSIRDEGQIRQELDRLHAPATMPAAAP